MQVREVADDLLIIKGKQIRTWSWKEQVVNIEETGLTLGFWEKKGENLEWQDPNEVLSLCQRVQQPTAAHLPTL